MPPNGTRRKAALAVSALVVLSVYGVWLARMYRGEPVDSLLMLLGGAIAAASAYTLFGKKAWESATDTVGEAMGEGDDNDE